jgi:hypothetical protein
MLETEGWKVWWDTSLAIGDDFRNEIMTETIFITERSSPLTLGDSVT